MNSPLAINNILPFTRYMVLLALLTILSTVYSIEESLELPVLMIYVSVGAILAITVSKYYRDYLLIGLSAICLLHIYGLVNGLLILVGLFLFIALAVSKLGFIIKVILSGLLLLVLFLLRLELFFNVPGDTALVVISGLVMFRLASLYYISRTRNTKVTLPIALNYFLLLPNLIFQIFPIVDYRDFVEKQVRQITTDHWRKGLYWICLGYFYLLVYRLLYYYVLPDKRMIQEVSELFLYHVVNYILIIRLVGIFHLCVGVLVIFGYDLPKVFNRMFLSRSFSDLWRRLNIYWKDFIMKLFYYPLYFKWRKKLNAPILWSIMVVFVLNWALHSYQWMWILGSYQFRMNDALFWIIFGVLVAINSMYDSRNVQKSTNLKVWSEWSKVFAMFLFMSVIWTFWTSDSIRDWLSLFKDVEYGDFTKWSQVFLQIGLLGIVLFVAVYLEITGRMDRIIASSFDKGIWVINIFVFVMLMVGAKPVADYLKTSYDIDMSPIRKLKLNSYDEHRMFKGYYESLLVTGNMSNRLWEINKKKPKSWKRLNEVGLLQREEVSGYPFLLPNQDVEFKEKRLTTNEHGMRDGHYDLKKPEGVFRIALLGGSNEMGSGVGDDETYENIAERRLNKEIEDSIEIMNFSISGIHIVDQLLVLDKKVSQFDPDLIIYAAHSMEEVKNLKSFYEWFLHPEWRTSLTGLNELYLGAEIDTSMSRRRILADLEDYKRELTDWGVIELQKKCAELAVHFVWMYVPLAESERFYDEQNELTGHIESFDIETINLYRAFDGYGLEELKLAEWDFHYSKKAHELLSEKFYNALKDAEWWNAKEE